MSAARFPLAFLSQFVVALACAQVPTPVPATAKATVPGNRFVLEAGDLKIGDLIDKAATFLGRNIVVLEVELAQAGSSSLRLQQRIDTDAAGCEELLANLLYARGYAVVPLDESKNVYEVIFINGQRGREIAIRAPMRTLEQVLARPQMRVAVTTVVPLQNINATVACNALRPFFASGPGAAGCVTIGTAGTSSSLLLSGFQDQVAAAIRLLQIVDTAAQKDRVMLDERLVELERRLAALESKLGVDAKKEAPK